jgi:hypothetical protein
MQGSSFESKYCGFVLVLKNQINTNTASINPIQIFFRTLITIFSRSLCVTIDGVWIGEQIYQPFIGSNYK